MPGRTSDRWEPAAVRGIRQEYHSKVRPGDTAVGSLPLKGLSYPDIERRCGWPVPGRRARWAQPERGRYAQACRAGSHSGESLTGGGQAARGDHGRGCRSPYGQKAPGRHQRQPTRTPTVTARQPSSQLLRRSLTAGCAARAGTGPASRRHHDRRVHHAPGGQHADQPGREPAPRDVVDERPAHVVKDAKRRRAVAIGTSPNAESRPTAFSAAASAKAGPTASRGRRRLHAYGPTPLSRARQPSSSSMA
jgi:hypothetical protein